MGTDMKYQFAFKMQTEAAARSRRRHTGSMSRRATQRQRRYALEGKLVEEVLIRQGRPSDRSALERLLASQRMATDIDPAGFIMAEVNGRLLGAARLIWVGAYDAFLRPVVVATEARGTGLGRALVERLFGACSRISVIARRDAVPFYRHLGFTAVDWSSIPSAYMNECECCDDFEQCRPVSMRWPLKNE